MPRLEQPVDEPVVEVEPGGVRPAREPVGWIRGHDDREAVAAQRRGAASARRPRRSGGSGRRRRRRSSRPRSGPARAAKVSQMLGPLPSSVAAPSIWYARGAGAEAEAGREQGEVVRGGGFGGWHIREDIGMSMAVYAGSDTVVGARQGALDHATPSPSGPTTTRRTSASDRSSCHNDDLLDPSSSSVAGYPEHPHAELVIVTWVLERGARAHRLGGPPARGRGRPAPRCSPPAPASVTARSPTRGRGAAGSSRPGYARRRRGASRRTSWPTAPPPARAWWRSPVGGGLPVGTPGAPAPRRAAVDGGESCRAPRRPALLRRSSATGALHSLEPRPGRWRRGAYASTDEPGRPRPHGHRGPTQLAGLDASGLTSSLRGSARRG